MVSIKCWKLIVWSIATRPDIAQVVRAVKKFNSNPNEAYITAVKWIMQYLKGTIDIALYYKKTKDGVLIGYFVADWTGDQDDNCSTIDNLFLMSGGVISWLSKKQPSVASSVALSMAAQEAVWLRKIFPDLQAKPKDPTVMMDDNNWAKAISKKHASTKHINIQYCYVLWSCTRQHHQFELPSNNRNGCWFTNKTTSYVMEDLWFFRWIWD